MSTKSRLEQIRERLKNAVPNSSELLSEGLAHLKNRRQLYTDDWSEDEIATFKLGFRRGVIERMPDIAFLLKLVEKHEEAFNKLDTHLSECIIDGCGYEPSMETREDLVAVVIENSRTCDEMLDDLRKAREDEA